MKVQVVTPWYPDPYSPYSGVFVKKQVDALVASGHQVSVEKPEIYPAPAGQIPEEVWDAMRRLGSLDPGALFAEHGEATKAPAPVPSRAGLLGRANAFGAALGLKREFLPVDYDVTHAHLGIPTGLAVLELGDRPLVVTEHQSTLSRVFGEPGGVDAYRRVVEESEAFLCVSDHLRGQILEAIGTEFSEKIRVVPNVVDLSDISFRLRTDEQTSHWIYVGTLARHKGVELLLRSFKLYSAADDSARLTIVGEGPHFPWVERFIASNGLGPSVHLTGSVSHHEVGQYLNQADVMVHLSFGETFGIASLEGIGAGLPVVSLRNAGAESGWGDIEPKAGRLLPMDAMPEHVADAVWSLYGADSPLDLAHARQIVESRFSATNVATTLGSIYEQVT